MANTASLLLYLFGRGLQALFFGQLRPVEVEVCTDHIRAHKSLPD